MNTQTPKIALITGGSRGLGRNTAESLARKGIDSVISYNSRADEARKVVTAIQAEGRQAVALQLDTGAVGMGVFFLTQKLLPLINDGGRIVNLLSGLTRIIFPGSAAYGSMKGAIEVLTKYMAKELGPRRITVNVVAPGAIATDFSGGMVRDNPEINKRVADATALGRVGLPDDIGPMIASLLSEDNRWVNAQRIEASGGMSI
jgi:NAD(P)-dependent dehydrogenase (short-subunit alcohol dehydrogenase family)